MATGIERVTFDDAAEKLRDQIKSAFVELLTPEQWQAMVRKELESFFQPRITHNHYSGNVEKTEPSLFNDLVRGVFEEEVKRHAVGVIKCGDWNPASGSFWAWGHFDDMVSKAVTDWLNENAKELLSVTLFSLMGGAAQQILAQVRDSYGPRCSNCGRLYDDPASKWCHHCGTQG